MFGYRCEKCHDGTVKATTLERFETRFDGTPFVVENATVGICDQCGAKYFNASEWKAWRERFWKSQESEGRLLSAGAITQIRKSVSMGIADFARLIGCSRQSLYSWECATRKIPQSRMADLILKLVRESHDTGAIDVVNFLLRESGLTTVRNTPAGNEDSGRHGKREAVTRATYDLAKVDPRRYEQLFTGSSEPDSFSPALRAVA